MRTVVTGGGRGIGAAIALRLARDGHDLVLGYRSDRAAARRTAEEARALGADVLVAQVDVADPDSVTTFIAAAGGFTGLVTNAGEATAVGRLEDLDLAAIRHDLDVLLLGTIACARAAIPVLKAEGGGAIVTISSGVATIGGAGQYVHYAAAKAAVDAFTLGLGRELARDGIRVNAVAPGIVRTGFHADPDLPDRAADSIPIGRPAEPAEIAGAVAWLLSPDASYTTGTVLRVAGGR